MFNDLGFEPRSAVSMKCAAAASLAERKAIEEVTMHPDDELASLRHLLDALESGSMKLLLNGRDVTQEEVAKLKPDIEYLESVLARIRSSRKSHA
jgi:hypothetical protein